MVFTVKNGTDLLQVFNFTSKVATNLSISLSCIKCFKNQACCNLSFADLLQHVETSLSQAHVNASGRWLLDQVCCKTSILGFH